MKPILQSPSIDYFRGLVCESLSRQKMKVNVHTEYYLVTLLARYGRMDEDFAQESSRAMAIRLAQALQAGGTERWTRLRELGDHSLFFCGFFSDSFNRRLVDVDYCAAIGQQSYSAMAGMTGSHIPEVFCDLSRKFIRFADILADVCSQTTITSGQSTLRIYERWLRTGSQRDARFLRERGIAPNSSIARRFIQ
jgi:hypothetical protein